MFLRTICYGVCILYASIYTRRLCVYIHGFPLSCIVCIYYIYKHKHTAYVYSYGVFHNLSLLTFRHLKDSIFKNFRGINNQAKNNPIFLK